MRHNPAVHHRRSIRLRTWNYSESGAYFVTICTHDRECILDDAANLAIVEDVWRRVVGSGHGPGEFVAMPNHVHGIVWIAEPDAVGTAFSTRRDAVGPQQPDGAFEEPRTPSNDYPFMDRRRGEATTSYDCRNASLYRTPFRAKDALVASPLRFAVGPSPGSLGQTVGSFKSATAKRINNRRHRPGAPVWQRNYYEHIIRDEDDLNRVRQYILDNPRKWAEDPDNPAVFMNHHGGKADPRRG